MNVSLEVGIYIFWSNKVSLRGGGGGKQNY